MRKRSTKGQTRQTTRKAAAAPAPASTFDHEMLGLALARLHTLQKPPEAKQYPIQHPFIPPGVVPAGTRAPVLAMDYAPYVTANALYPGGGFPGFPYLSQLSTRPEYRAFAGTMSTELTREWIKFTSKQDDDSASNEKIKKIEEVFKELDVRGVIQTAAAHDSYFGRAQIFLTIAGAEDDKPLILDPATVPKGSLKRVSPVEAIWTTPNGYDTINPAAPDFYRPSTWFMLGRQVHSSRLMTIITRPLPDILKPAFNFAGISMSQLAEPYVDNWLRTRQSVADLINNFSITVLKTAMDQVLQGTDDGADVVTRAQLFNVTRSNLGVMLLDKDREDLGQVNTPLSGLAELQEQSQQQMSTVSRIPSVILTGSSPGGLNASSEGEIRVFYDWIAAQQESFWRAPIETILKVVQLSEFGQIDPDIGFEFVPLYQMTAKELAEIRKSDADRDAVYIDAGVLDPGVVLERLANDPDSGYQGIDLATLPEPPPELEPGEIPFGGDPDSDQDQVPAQDAGFNEGDHPRRDDGKFGSGGGGKKAPAKKAAPQKEAKRPAMSEQISKHPHFTQVDYDYLAGKGYTDEDILGIWERDRAAGHSPVTEYAKVPDLVAYLNK